MLSVERNLIQRGDYMGKEYSRDAAVELINSWVGLKVADGSYKSILDIYNSQKTLPRGVKMKPGMAWCATTVSAVGIKLKYDGIFPIECSCSRMIAKAIKMGIWKEDDAYVPKPGDFCLYDWDDNGKGDNKGTPDHVGMVTYVNKKAGYFVVTEGNNSRAVKKRTISINGRYIRGFIVPKYTSAAAKANVAKAVRKSGQTTSTLAHEILTGLWGSDENAVKRNLLAMKYSTKEATAAIKAATKLVSTPNGKTTATANAKSHMKVDKNGVVKTVTNVVAMRNDAGINKATIIKLPAKATVTFYGYCTAVKKEKWLLVEYKKGKTKYTGFVPESSLK